jgi:hypothetical protein
VVAGLRGLCCCVSCPCPEGGNHVPDAARGGFLLCSIFYCVLRVQSCWWGDWCNGAVGGRLRRSLSASLETGSVPALRRSGWIVAATAAAAAALESRQPAQYPGGAAAVPTCGALAVSSTIPGPNCSHPDGRSGPGKGIQDCGRHPDMLGWCAAVPWS